MSVEILKIAVFIKIHLGWGNEHKHIQNYIQRLICTNQKKMFLQPLKTRFEEKLKLTQTLSWIKFLETSFPY